MIKKLRLTDANTYQLFLLVNLKVGSKSLTNYFLIQTPILAFGRTMIYLLMTSTQYVKMSTFVLAFSKVVSLQV